MKNFFNNVYKVLIEKRTDFSGRASRSEYWSSWLFIQLTSIFLLIFALRARPLLLIFILFLAINFSSKDYRFLRLRNTAHYYHTQALIIKNGRFWLIAGLNSGYPTNAKMPCEYRSLLHQLVLFFRDNPQKYPQHPVL